LNLEYQTFNNFNIIMILKFMALSIIASYYAVKRVRNFSYIKTSKLMR